MAKNKDNQQSDLIESIMELAQQLDAKGLAEVRSLIREEEGRKEIIETAQQDAKDAAERYREAVKGNAPVEWEDGTIVGPGEKVMEDDTEYVNTSNAWLSVAPSEYPLGYERTTPLDADDVPEFTADEDVQPGDLRLYDGIVYEVLQAHTTADHWSPDTAVSLWTKA